MFKKGNDFKVVGVEEGENSINKSLNPQYSIIPKKASDTQIAGSHYSKLKIQPMKYALENNLNYAQANAIKYITRYKDKNGIEDLRKAIHCIELLIEHEESN